MEAAGVEPALALQPQGFAAVYRMFTEYPPKQTDFVVHPTERYTKSRALPSRIKGTGTYCPVSQATPSLGS